MEFLDYIKSAAQYSAAKRESFSSVEKITLVTNFTDDILQKLLTGICLQNDFYPEIYKTPYKQYHFELKNDRGGLYIQDPNITFIFFDANPFKRSEFQTTQGHFKEVFIDLERYIRATKGTVVINTFILSYQSAYGNLFQHGPWFKLVQEYNAKLEGLAKQFPNTIIFDTNRLVHLLGEKNIFDARGSHAFDIPFTHEFMATLAEEWFAIIRAGHGGSKKCIVLDLDNTLWGGVVGELGAHGIALGPDYPGNAFVGFQNALLDFYHRGIILAIASKNNLEDVLEAFRDNPFMVLKEENFSAIKANWNEKVDSIREIASELNIGTDSMVFLDDDPLSRERIKLALPEVSVPDFSLRPEEYTQALYSLKLFHQLSLTDEDRQKGKMYADEHQRKKIRENTGNIDDYIKELNIVMHVSVNDASLIPRLAQLTTKTNQFNLTTRRYTEHNISQLIDRGAFVFSANVSDRFGDYGIVIEAIVTPETGGAFLDTFLMSCRVMGRGVEYTFIDHVIRELHKRGFTKLAAEFIPTAKNKPSEHFLDEHGFSKQHKKDGDGEAMYYTMDVPTYLKAPCSKANKTITITT